MKRGNAAIEEGGRKMAQKAQKGGLSRDDPFVLQYTRIFARREDLPQRALVRQHPPDGNGPGNERQGN
jgi:hypothetical protein